MNQEGEEDKQNCKIDNNSNKKKRKTNETVTTQKRGYKGTSRKKNVSGDRINTTSPCTAQKIGFDLRLEAKLSTEEYSRMFGTRKLHPFFSSWKVGKKSQEPANVDPSLCTASQDNGRITLGPIHVFENCGDDTPSLDWSNWTFLDNNTITGCNSESSNSSVAKCSVEPLNFDNLVNVPDPSCAISMNAFFYSKYQSSVLPDYLQEISLANFTGPPNEQTMRTTNLVDSEVYTYQHKKSNIEPMSTFLPKRSSYYSCQDKVNGSLWTHKYKPTKTLHVCGNKESMNLLRDWLHFWSERRQSIKDSSNMAQNDMQDSDSDYNGFDSDDDYKGSDSDDDYNDGKSVPNILLITGPVGSGKSAAIYACALEQGFDVLELNASDRRNGTAVKKYFGDALGSHGCKRLLEHTMSSPKKTVKSPVAIALPNKAAVKMDDGVTELINISDDESDSPDGTSLRLHSKNSVFTRGNAQTLILVEDVDVLFPEDRGCIAAIKQIAETAKGPIILTSNSNKAGLPDNFDRLHISFSLPSPHELLCHMYKVCDMEKANINPLLLERFIQSCNGDIRKTIMQLQFWIQSKKCKKDQKVQTVYGSLPFDLEAGHQILPKIIPWSFPSELSKIIEKEVANSVTILEENSCMSGLVKTVHHANERKNDLDVHYLGIDHVEAKKRGMRKRNRSIVDYSEFESQYNSIFELSSCSRFPGASSWSNGQRKLVLVSSDTMDKDPNGHFLNAHDEAYKGQSHEVENGIGINLAEVSLNNGFTPFTSHDRHCLAEFPQNSEPLVNTKIPESSPKATMQDFRDESMKTTIVQNVTDKCIHDDFKLKSVFVGSNPSIEADVVQNLWRKLRDCRTDLRHHASSEQLGATQVLKHASGLSNLLSEADLLFHNHQQKQCGIIEHPIFLSDEATFSWYDEQTMMSTIAIHGFCFHAKHVSDVGSKLGCETNSIDLASGMLACTTDIMALGKLSRQDHTKALNIYAKNQLEQNKPRYDKRSENKTSLFNVIHSIVPARLSLALKGVAFNEYLSSLRQISISEDFRIAQSVEKKRGRRTRSSQHYLSRGTMSLSPEDILLACEGDLYKKVSSQYTANLGSSCS